MDEALTALARFYGPIPPPPRELFPFFVWDVISARTLPARRDRVWHALKLLPVLSPDAMFRTSTADLKAALESLGHVEERLDALREGSGHFRRHRDLADRVARSVRSATRVFRDIPHLTPVARATGIVFVGRHPVPAADAGSLRVIQRIEGLTASRPAAQRRACRRRLARVSGGDVERLGRALLLFGHHAQHACAEQAPHCAVCPLRDTCAHASRGENDGEAPAVS